MRRHGGVFQFELFEMTVQDQGTRTLNHHASFFILVLAVHELVGAAVYVSASN